MKEDFSSQIERSTLIRAIAGQKKLRQLFLPGLFVLLMILLLLGRSTEAQPMIFLGAVFIIISFSLFFFAASFIERTPKLGLEQIQQILSGIFILEVLTVWLTFYLFSPVAAAFDVPLPYLAIVFYVFYIVLVAPFFRRNNAYQSFFYGVIWLGLALLIYLHSNCRFIFAYGAQPDCPIESVNEIFLFVVSGMAIFMVQFVVNHFHDQMDWTTRRQKEVNRGLQDKLRDEGYQVVRLRQEQNEMKVKFGRRLQEKDQQIKEISQKLKGRLEKKGTSAEDEDFAQMKQTTEALLNILEDTEEARQKAEQERERTLTIINNFVDALLVVDEQGLIRMANSRAREVFHLEEEVEGKALMDFSKHPRLKGALRHILDGRRIKVVKREGFEMKEGTFFEVSTVPLNQGGETTGYLIVFHDISREKLVQRMKTEFVSIAAHQLRTPLSAAKWSLRMLLDGDEGELSSKQKGLMEKTYLSNQRMINLVNDLLNVSRIEEGRFLYEKEEAELAEIIRRVIEGVSETARRRKIKISFQGERKPLPGIKVDREKMTLAVQNIVENAVKYSPDESRVEISLEEDDGFLLVAIKDQGIGIPRTQQSRVFQRFFRAGNAIGQETEGTGLGLFISRNVIEAHGGKIWFESREGKGTTFYFTVPY